MARKPIVDPPVVSRKHSITRLYWIGLVVLAAVPTLALGYFWVADQFVTFRDQSASLRHSYLESREQYLRRETGEVFDYIDFKRAEIDQRLREDLKDTVGAALLALGSEAASRADLNQQHAHARNLLKKVVFGAGSDHLFLVDADGVVLLMPISPHMVGHHVDEFRDAGGTPYLASVLAQARVQGEGFTAAWLSKPGGTRSAYSTQVYLRFFPALNLYVGGIGYVEDRVQATQNEVLARFRAATADDLLLTIVDYDGQVVLHSRDAIGGATSIAALRDADGRSLAPQLQAAIDRPQGAVVHSRWANPGQAGRDAADHDDYLQINYARAYPSWRWIIVAGFALRDLDATIERQHDEMKQRVQRRIAYVSLAVVGLLLLATLLAQRLSTRTQQALRQFNRAFEESSRSNTPIDIDHLSLLEFEPLAIDANRMLDYRVGIENELVSARLAAESANQAKSQFLSTMSHELRTPLNGVLGYAQILMRDPQLTPDQHRHLTSIESCGQHLLTLINDVLDLAKIESGALEMQPVDCNVYQTLHAVGDIVRGKAEAKGLAFRLDIGPQVPEHAWLDEVKLRQVLVNLLGNAVKFTERGSITLSVRRSESDPQLIFAVTDTGIGIARDRQQEIFQPFRQAHAHGGGSGLGLAISERVSRAMGGQLQVESALGSGSRFTLTLPLVATSVATPLPQTLVSGGQQILDLPPSLTLMVVDDNTANRLVLSGLLRSLGCDIVEAENGVEALVKLRSRPVPLVFMDVRMSLMDGIETTRRIKQDPALRHIVVIAVSASVFPEVIEQMRSAGCDDFINKPVQFSELTAKLSQHLGASVPGRWVASTGGALHRGEALPAEFRIALQAAIAEGDMEAMYAALRMAEQREFLSRQSLHRLRTLLDNFDIEAVRDWLAPAAEPL